MIQFSPLGLARWIYRRQAGGCGESISGNSLSADLTSRVHREAPNQRYGPAAKNVAVRLLPAGGQSLGKKRGFAAGALRHRRTVHLWATQRLLPASSRRVVGPTQRGHRLPTTFCKLLFSSLRLSCWSFLFRKRSTICSAAWPRHCTKSFTTTFLIA